MIAPGYDPAFCEWAPTVQLAEPVIPLDAAVSAYRKSAARSVPDAAGSGSPYVFDAGFASTWTVALPIVRAAAEPATNA